MTGIYQFNITLDDQVTGNPNDDDPGSGFTFLKNTDSYGGNEIHATWMQVANEDNHDTTGDGYADTLVSGEVSMYCKDGDTVKVKVINPNVDSADESRVVGFNQEEGFTNPFPTSVADPGGNTSVIYGWNDDEAIWSYTVDKDDTGWAVQYNEDNTAKASPPHQVSWLWIGEPATAGGDYEYSGRVTFRLVQATIGAEAVAAGGGQTIAQGASVTFTATNITGLMPSSVNKHNLYLGLYNSSGNLVGTGDTGVSWDSSANQIGVIKTTDTATVMTAGDDLPLGTYTAHLCHFNSSHGLGGDFNDSNWSRYVAPENSIDSIDLSVVGTTVSWVWDLGDDINAGSDTSYELVKNTGAVIIVPSSGTALVSVSGNNNVKFARRDYNWYVYDDPPTNASGLYVNHGWDVTFYMDGPTGLDESVTGTLTTGPMSDSVTITTTSGGTDITPNPFEGDLGDDPPPVALNTAVTSSTATIDGLTGSAPVSVSGDGNPTVSINGGSYVTSGYITNNQTATLRFTSSGSFSTARTATLLIGPVGDEETDSVTATTISGEDDTEPADFDSSLGADQTVALNATVTSSTATITGIDAASPVTISGPGSPQFSINGGSWVTSGNITVNQTIQLRFTAAGTYGTDRTAVLNIGGITGQVKGTTVSEDTPYGLQVFNENASTEIFGYNVSGAHFIATGTVTLANGATSVVAVEGVENTTANESVILIGFDEEFEGTITRGTDQVTFGNSSGGSITFTYHITRT